MPVRASDLVINGKRYSLAEGRDSYLIDVATPLAPKVVTGDYGYSDFTAYSVLAQSSLKGGAGQYKVGDPEFFHWSERLDTRGDLVTLGVKTETMQPTVLERAGTLGKPHLPGDALNAVCANETYQNQLEWLKLGMSWNSATARFKAQEVSPGEPAPVIPDMLVHLDANVGITREGAAVSAWVEQAHGYTLNSHHGPIEYVDNVAHGMPMIKGAGGGMSGWVPIGPDSDRTIVMVGVMPAGLGDGALFGFGDWVSGSNQWLLDHWGFLYFNTGLIGGVHFDLTFIDDAVFILSLKSEGVSMEDGFRRLWLDSVRHDAIQGGENEFFNNGPALSIFCGAKTDTGTAIIPLEYMIGEMFVFGRGLSFDERWLLESYLSSKWVAGQAYGHTLAIESPTVIERVWYYLRSHTSLDSGAVVASLCEDDGGLPGAVLASAEVEKVLVTGYGSWVPVEFSSSALVPGQYYHVEIDASALLRGENVEWLVGEDIRSLGLGGITKTDYDGRVEAELGPLPLCLGQYPDLAPDTPVVKWLEFKGQAESFYVYGLAGKRLYRMATPLSQTPVRDAVGVKLFATDGTDLLAVTPDYALELDVTPRMLVALGVDTDMEEWNGDIVDGSGWATITGWQARRLLFFDNLYWRASYDEERGWFVQGSYEYEDWTESLAGGDAGEWGIVGDPRFPVNGLFGWKGQLYAGKSDGLYILTPEPGYPASGKLVVTKQLDLSSEIHPNNFEAFAEWHDDLYFSLGHGVAKLTSGNVFSSVGPERGLGDGGYTRGRFTSFHSTLTQMYATYTGNANQWSSVMSYTGGWHIIASSGRVGDAMGSLFVDSGLYSEFPALWFSNHALVSHALQPTESLRRWTYVDRDRGDSSPIRFFDRSPGNNFSEAPGILVTSWFSGKMATVIKSWTVLDIEADSIGPEQRIDLYYRREDYEDFIFFGSVTASGLSRVASAGEMYGDLLAARRSNSPVKLVLLDGREIMCDISSLNSTTARRYEHNQSVLDLAYIVRLALLEAPGVPVPEAP